MSRLIPVLRGGRARSASPNILPTTLASRITPLRTATPLSAFLDNRTFVTSALSGSNHDVGVRNWEKKTSLMRSFSDVAVPEPPTSNHPHKPLPGAKGHLIYTETYVIFLSYLFFPSSYINTRISNHNHHFLLLICSDEAPALATFSLLPVLSKVRQDTI